MTAPAPAATASEYQAAQSGLADALSAQVLAAWPALLDVNALQRTIPYLSAGVAALVHRYGSASAAVATRFYDSARAAAAVKGSFTVVPAQPAAFGQVDKSVRWATRGLWSADPQVEAAKTLVKGAATRMALDAGRNTVTGAAQADPRAAGWVRHAQPGACAFCLLLSTRGPGYNSRQSAGFQAHDHDHCTAVPVFGPWEPSADTRHWQQVYRQAARAGSGKTVRDEFRRLVDAHRAPQGPAQGESTPHGG